MEPIDWSYEFTEWYDYNFTEWYYEVIEWY